MKFYVIIICDNSKLKLMSCTWSPSMYFLLFPIAYLLIWHFCTCIPDKILCVCDLFWVGQFGSTYFLCPMILHVFWDFPINGLAGIFTAQKIIVTWSGRKLSVIIKIWLQIVSGLSIFDTAQTLKYIGLCSIGASNFVLMSPSFSLSFA